jgi:hypothetical protein
MVITVGAHLAVEVVKRGFKCVRVFSIWDSPLTSLVQVTKNYQNHFETV